jgi:hypothetical protein
MRGQLSSPVLGGNQCLHGLRLFWARVPPALLPHTQAERGTGGGEREEREREPERKLDCICSGNTGLMTLTLYCEGVIYLPAIKLWAGPDREQIKNKTPGGWGLVPREGGRPLDLEEYSTGKRALPIARRAAHGCRRICCWIFLGWLVTT